MSKQHRRVWAFSDRSRRHVLAAVALALASCTAMAAPPAAAGARPPTNASGWVVLSPRCLKAPRHKALTRDAFGLAGDLYLDSFNRKLERTYVVSQPQPLADGSIPGGQVQLEIVLDTHGHLCGYRPRGQADPALVKAAAGHLLSVAPFPPLPGSIAAVADAVHLVQSWSYRGKRTRASLMQHRLDLQGGGDTHHQTGSARYDVGVPLP